MEQTVPNGGANSRENRCTVTSWSRHTRLVLLDVVLCREKYAVMSLEPLITRMYRATTRKKTKSAQAHDDEEVDDVGAKEHDCEKRQR